ncbi:MAG: hypothetical protein NC548_28475 [Lachnospiraceae bacterium]|nr:hypothetical protein [Lachnospiraceae bacterium]MCM1234114.1 hypothetical protein [Ruminococcus flavefaciens]
MNSDQLAWIIIIGFLLLVYVIHRVIWAVGWLHILKSVGMPVYGVVFIPIVGEFMVYGFIVYQLGVAKWVRGFVSVGVLFDFIPFVWIFIQLVRRILLMRWSHAMGGGILRGLVAFLLPAIFPYVMWSRYTN